MTIVAQHFDTVIGVDTHARTHSLAVIDARTGGEQVHGTFDTTPAGLARAVSWVQRHSLDPAVTLISMEGTGSYGAQFAGALTKAGYRVVEAPAPAKSRSKKAPKSDRIDAVAAARALLPVDLDRLVEPRSHHTVQALVSHRDHLSKTRTAVVNRLTALLRVHNLGIDARRALNAKQIRQISTWRTRQEPVDLAIIRDLAMGYAREINDLDQQLRQNHKMLRDYVKIHAPYLLEIHSIGPVTAAVALAAWSHPGRVMTEARFAALAGTAPIPASSGNTTAQRLNRGGDRRLNSAIHMAMLSRLRTADTKAYMARRAAEGKCPKKTRRLIKRYIARQLFKALQANA